MGYVQKRVARKKYHITTQPRVLALKEDKNAVETQGRWRVVSGSYSTWRTLESFYSHLAQLVRASDC